MQTSKNIIPEGDCVEKSGVEKQRAISRRRYVTQTVFRWLTTPDVGASGKESDWPLDQLPTAECRLLSADGW